MSKAKQKLAEMKSANTVDDVVSWLWDDVPLPEKAAGRSGQMTSSDLFKMLRMYERGASAKEISEAIGRSQGVVHTTLSRIRKQVNSRDLPKETQEKMRQVEQEFMDDWRLYRAAQPVNKMDRLFDYIRSIRKK